MAAFACAVASRVAHTYHVTQSFLCPGVSSLSVGPGLDLLVAFYILELQVSVATSGLDCFLTGKDVCKGHSLLGIQTLASSCVYPIEGVQVCSLTLWLLHAKIQA